MASRRVWKYTIAGNGNHYGVATIGMPAGAKILSVAVQKGMPCLWAEVDPDLPNEQRQFHVVLTGELMPKDADRFVGTFMLNGGEYVYHVYERTQRAEA